MILSGITSSTIVDNADRPGNETWLEKSRNVGRSQKINQGIKVPVEFTSPWLLPSGND